MDSRNFGHNGEKRKDDKGNNGNFNSYAHVLKGVSHPNGDTTNTPSLVIGDDYVVLGNKGFNEIGIQYLGGLWVMLVFRSVDGKEKFKVNVGTNSWFSQLIETFSDFVVDGRVSWVEVEGIPLKVWTDNTFKRIASKWGTLLSIDNSEEDCYHNKCICIFTADMGPKFKERLDEDSESEDDIFRGVDKPNTNNSDEEFEDENVVSDTVFNDGSVKPSVVKNSSGNQGNKSEDPFDLYPLLNKNKGEKNKDSNCCASLKFPPGFTPSVEKEVGCNMDKHELNYDNLNGGASNQGDHVNDGIDNSYSKREDTKSVGSGRFKKGDALRIGGSILTVMDELIKVGLTMGFKIDGCMKNIKELLNHKE
nr:hypothetical protein [Tanacetum cinerariifolium]